MPRIAGVYPQKIYILLAFLILITAPVDSARAGLQDDLNARWGGSWVVVDGELASNCDGSYTNNEANGRLVRGDGRVTLPPGELARIHKMDLKKHRVDVFLDVQEPVLLPHQVGPFELYQEFTCQVELLVHIPGEKAKAQGLAEIETELDLLLDRYLRAEEAQTSPNWNRRERKSYPPDYEETLAEYRAWKVEAFNEAVEVRIGDSLETSSRLMASIQSVTRSGPRYQAEFGTGLVLGIGVMTENLQGSCEQLVASQTSTYARSVNAPNRAWADGFNAGQRLAYHAGLAERLQSCFATPPPPPVASSSGPSWEAPPPAEDAGASVDWSFDDSDETEPPELDEADLHGAWRIHVEESVERMRGLPKAAGESDEKLRKWARDRAANTELVITASELRFSLGNNQLTISPEEVRVVEDSVIYSYSQGATDGILELTLRTDGMLDHHNTENDDWNWVVWQRAEEWTMPSDP